MTQSKDAAPERRKESAEVVRASGQDATMRLPRDGVPGSSDWENTSGKAQDQGERLWPNPSSKA